MNPSPVSPFDRVSVLLILGSIACVAVYVCVLQAAGAHLEDRLEEARVRAARAERLCDEKDEQMNGALEEITRLKGEDASG